MGLNKRPDVPGSFKGMPICKVRNENKHCGKPAPNWLLMTIRIMERDTKVRYAMCDDHFKEATDGTDESRS